MTNLKEICINEGIELTQLPDHAIYILPDGSLIDGCFYDNDRSEDHRLAESLSEFDRYDGNRFWLDLFNNLNMIMSVPLQISVEIGRTTKPIKDILDFTSGTIVELDKQAGSQIDVYVNGKRIARGDVVVVDDFYGVRITEVLSSEIMKLI